MIRLCGNRFQAGGFVVNVAAGVRQRVFARILNRPHLEIILVSLHVGNQSTGNHGPVELLHNGATIYQASSPQNPFSYDQFLPYLRLPAQGTLEGFLTNADAVNPGTLDVVVEGFYVPQGDRL